MECSPPIPDSTTNMDEENCTKVKPFDLSINKCTPSVHEVQSDTTTLKPNSDAVASDKPVLENGYPLDYSVSKRTREDVSQNEVYIPRKKRRNEEVPHFEVMTHYLKSFLENDSLEIEKVSVPESQSDNKYEIEILPCRLNDSQSIDNKIKNIEKRSSRYNKYKKRIYQKYQRVIDGRDNEVELIELNYEKVSEPPELIPIKEIEERYLAEPGYQECNSTVSFQGYNYRDPCDCCQRTENFAEDSLQSSISSQNCISSSSSSPSPTHSLLHAHQMLMQKRERYLKTLKIKEVSSFDQEILSNYYYLPNNTSNVSSDHGSPSRFEFSCCECQSAFITNNTIVYGETMQAL